MKYSDIDFQLLLKKFIMCFENKVTYLCGVIENSHQLMKYIMYEKIFYVQCTADADGSFLQTNYESRSQLPTTNLKHVIYPIKIIQFVILSSECGGIHL